MGVRSGPKIPSRGSEFEVLANGTMDTRPDLVSDGWSKGTGWSIANGVATHVSSAGNHYLTQSFAIESARHYRFSFAITAYTSGTIRFYLGSSAVVDGSAANPLDITEAVGTFEFIVTGLDGNLSIQSQTGNAFIGSIDNVSLTPVDSPLILSLDAMNAKSFAGEPAVNLRGNEDFSTMSTYGGLDLVRAVESESPSGYACQMTINSSLDNSSSRSRWGSAGSTPTSGNAWLDVWVKGNMKTRVLGLKPSVFCGSSWHTLLPLDGGSVYITPGKYRRFGALCSFGTGSGGPNPGFSMTNATSYTSGASGQGAVTWWIKPMVTTKTHSVPFTGGTRAVANSWKDLSGRGNHGTHSAEDFGDSGDTELRRVGQILLPDTENITSAPASINFDGSNDYVYTSSDYSLSGDQTFEVWFQIKGGPDSPAGILVQHDYAVPANFGINHVSSNKLAPSISYTDGTREYSTKTTTTTFSHDTLYHVALVYHSSANKIIWYVNGEEDSQYTLSKTPAFGAEPFTLGRWSTAYNNYYFDGHIYKASVYATALSHVQIKDIYNSLRSRFGL